MSREDCWVEGRSDAEVRLWAKKTQNFFGVERFRPVSILNCLHYGRVKTILGLMPLAYTVLSNNALVDDDARTEFVDGTVIISVRQDVDQRAQMGVGRDRMTLAHELAHAVLHPGVAKARRAGAISLPTSTRVQAFRSAEHQAEVFAPAFLVHEDDARQMASADDIAVEFLISPQAAQILFEQLHAEKRRAANVDAILKKAANFRAEVQGESSKRENFLPEPCPHCGSHTRLPIGIKYLCTSCDTVNDMFQDGDRM